METRNEDFQLYVLVSAINEIIHYLLRTLPIRFQTTNNAEPKKGKQTGGISEHQFRIYSRRSSFV